MYAAFGLTAIVIYFARAIRWGSIQFWALILGAFVAITLAIVAAPVLARIEEVAEDFGEPRQYLSEGLLVAGLVAASVSGCLMLVLLVNAVASSLLELDPSLVRRPHPGTQESLATPTG